MAFNYNHTTLVGRLTKDPDITTISETPKANFSLAIDRPYRKEDGSSDTDFINVVTWGRLAEIAGQHLKKGQPLLVEGRIQVRQYEKESEKRWITEIQAENFQFLGTALKTTDNKTQKKSK